MQGLNYSLVIEATDDLNFFVFYSPDLKGFSGTGISLDACLQKAPMAMDEFVKLLAQEGLPIPPINPSPFVRMETSDRISPAA